MEGMQRVEEIGGISLNRTEHNEAEKITRMLSTANKRVMIL